jgi:hypothetical protein
VRFCFSRGKIMTDSTETEPKRVPGRPTIGRIEMPDHFRRWFGWMAERRLVTTMCVAPAVGTRSVSS